MRRFAFAGVMMLVAFLASASEAAPSCAREDFALAVDKAGAALRQINSDNEPRLRAKLSELKKARGWPDAGFEEKAAEVLQDDRIAALDMQANDLLAKLDTLGTVDPAADPDCTKLQELTAVGVELQVTVKAKAAYTLAKLDQMLAGPVVAAEPKPKSADVRPVSPQAQPPAPKTASRAPDVGGDWAAKTAPPKEVASSAPPPPPPTFQPPPPQTAPAPVPSNSMALSEDEGYSIDEIARPALAFSARSPPTLAPSLNICSRRAGVPPVTFLELRAVALS